MTEVLLGLAFLLFVLVVGVWAYATGEHVHNAFWQVILLLCVLGVLLGGVLWVVRGLWSILTTPFGG